MTTAADITIKKADGTTNIVWSLVAGSGGDKAPAVWKSNTATGTPGQKPTFSVWTQPNTANTGRRVFMNVTFPEVYTDSNTSLTQVRTKGNLKVEAFLPGDMSVGSEFAAQAMNLLHDALSVGTLSSGFAPT